MSDFPYPGLRPFHRDEVDIFFGRDEQIDQLLARLDKKRFLAVVGPSGCGKSSLVQTGLLNALETGFLASAGVRWRMATLRPGNQPLRNLARALLEKEALGPERGGDENSEAFLLATLRRGPLGLVEIRREVALPPNTNLLVLVDQFEEIFRYQQQYDINEADAFVALLLASAEQTEARLYVLITMRSDFLGDCTLFAGLPEALNDSQFLTPRLTREQLQEAIIGPARVFGGEVEPALVNRLLNDMGTDPDQLPLMQHALMRLWNQASQQSPVLLTLGEYEAIGGLKEALSRHADEAYEQLDGAQKTIAETLFRSLCERSAARHDTRRPVRLEDVAAVAGVKWEQVAAVVEVFRHPNRSFLMPPVGTRLKPDTTIDISHESLIRQWQRLQTWVADEAQRAEEYRRWRERAIYRERGGELLMGADLARALEWRAERDGWYPTVVWAARYALEPNTAEQELKRTLAYITESKAREDERRRQEMSMLRLSMPYAAFHLLAGITLLYEYKYRQNKTVGDLFQREFSFLRDGGFIGPATLEFDKGLDGTNMVGKAIPTEIGLLYVKLHKEEVPTDWLSTNPEKRSNLKIDVALNLGFQLANDGAFRSARKRVLWVDEQPQNNENGINALESQNIEVVTCKSTREALEEIKKQGFDVIITDLFRYEDGIQKDEAGYELIRALRINGIKAPVILSTTSPDNDDAHRRGFFAAVNTQLGVFEHVLNALQGT